MVGASPNWNRPSYFVMRYLQRKGYRVIPVNPRALDAPILGETVYPDLESIPVPVDVVDVFRRPEEVPGDRRARRSRSAPRCCGCSSGIRSAEAATHRRAGRPDVHRGPLHEDRVRPARRRAGLERHQHADHLEPPRPAARMTDDDGPGAARRATDRSRRRAVRLRDARRPRRRPAGPGRPARATCRSTRRPRTSSTTSTTRRRCSTSRPSATSTRGSRTRPSPRSRSGSRRSRAAGRRSPRRRAMRPSCSPSTRCSSRATTSSPRASCTAAR